MMRDSASPVVERPGLEDVAEEEDVFAAEGSKNTPEHDSCQVPGQKQVARAGEEEEGRLSVSQMEAEFAQLTFRKQVSYRKAIAKSGLHHLPCQPSTSSLNRTDPEASIRSTVDWTESALYGDHIWFETNVSGDYCYVGEQHCIARALQKSVSRRKCAACKIVAHTICIEQLEKFPSSRAILLDAALPLNEPNFRVRYTKLRLSPLLVCEQSDRTRPEVVSGPHFKQFKKKPVCIMISVFPSDDDLFGTKI